MDRLSLTFVALSYGAAAAMYLAFWLYQLVFRRERRGDGAASALLAATLLGAIWGAFGMGFGLTSQPAFLSLALAVDIVRYGAWYAFILLLLRSHAEPGKVSSSPVRVLAPIAALIVLAGFAVHGLIALGLASAIAHPGVAWLHALIMVVFGMVLLEQLVRNLSTDTTWHVKPLALGLAGAFAFDLYLYVEAVLFKRLGPDSFAARGFAHAAVVPLFWVASARTKDWHTKVRLSQKAAFQSVTLLFVGGSLLFMAAVGYYVRGVGGEWGSALATALVFALLLALGVLVFSESTRARLRVLVGKHFFNYRYDYREEWLRFTHTLSIQDTPESMGQQVVRGLANLVESPAGGLWLRDPEAREFTQAARWNTPECPARAPFDAPLCRFIESSGWVVNLEEYRSYPGRYNNLELPGWISEIPNAWLIVPLVVGNELTGFAILSSARTDLDINWEVNDLLRTAGRQAATFLAQMQATEALLEARKFDAFNRMSAFVVHDLKNIVTQLALLVKNAERHGANPEFQADMRMTVQHAVERMRQLMLQLREGATPPGTPVGVDLAAIVERTQSARKALGRDVTIEILDRLMTRGHEERIERVIGHLVQNALDATDGTRPRGRVWIKLARRGGQALLEVGDSGQGMAPEFVRERLFKPFNTTKPAGMGIGAYESFQYVQELGGKITVESELTVGTTITMLLPLFETGKQADRQNAKTQPESA